MSDEDGSIDIGRPCLICHQPIRAYDSFARFKRCGCSIWVDEPEDLLACSACPDGRIDPPDDGMGGGSLVAMASAGVLPDLCPQCESLCGMPPWIEAQAGARA